MPHTRLSAAGEGAIGLEEEVTFSSHEDLIDDFGEIILLPKETAVSPVHDPRTSASARGGGAKTIGFFSKKDKLPALANLAAGRGGSKRHAFLSSGLGDDDLLTPQEKIRTGKASKAALLLPDDLQVVPPEKGGWRAKLAGRGKKAGQGSPGNLSNTQSRQSGTSHASEHSRGTRPPSSSSKTASHPSLPRTNFSPMTFDTYISASNTSFTPSSTAPSVQPLHTPQSVQSRTGTLTSQDSVLPTPQSGPPIPHRRQALPGHGVGRDQSGSRESSLELSIIDEFPMVDSSRSDGRDSGSTIGAWSKEVDARTRFTPTPGSESDRRSTPSNVTAGITGTLGSGTPTSSGAATARGQGQTGLRSLPPLAPPPTGPLPPVPVGRSLELQQTAAAQGGPAVGLVDGHDKAVREEMDNIKIGSDHTTAAYMRNEARPYIQETEGLLVPSGPLLRMSPPMRAQQESGLSVDEEDSASAHSSFLLGSEASVARRRLQSKTPVVDLMSEMVGRADLGYDSEPEAMLPENAGKTKIQGRTIRFAG